MWVWSNLPAVAAQDRAALFALSQVHGMTTLYFQAQTLVYDDPQALVALVEDAATRGLEVEWLVGRHEWVRPAEHAALRQIVQDLGMLVKQMPGARPVALHLNAEPHALPEWDTDRQATANHLLDLLDALAGDLHGTGLALVYDMPNWYDEITVTRGGRTRPLSDWVIDGADRVCLMDYRDDVEAIQDLAAHELAYAGKVGRPLVLGVETGCGVADAVTWCEEGAAALAAGLAAVQQHLAGRPAFAGIAVHHWQALAALKP